MTTPSHPHQRSAAERGPVPVAVVTVSDTRTPESDVNHHYLRDAIPAAGHRLVAYRLVRDEPAEVVAALDELAAGEARVILLNGGTGLSRRDTTFDALSRVLEKTLPGFGELFRMLSFQEVGAAAMLSRATAGSYRGRFVASTPGSPAAVRLAWEQLLAPELAHIARELEK